MTLLPQPNLRGHNAPLVVDAHEDAKNRVEKDPGHHEGARRGAGLRKTDGAEDERDGGEEKPWFLVRVQGQEEGSRQSRKEGQPWSVRARNKKQSRAKEQRKGNQEVMVWRVEAVQGKVGDGGIIAERIERGDDRIMKQVPRERKGRRGGIKGGIDRDGQERG